MLCELTVISGLDVTITVWFCESARDTEIVSLRVYKESMLKIVLLSLLSA